MATTRFDSLPVTTRVYVGAVVAIGSATIVHSAYDLWAHPIPWDWAILAILTLVSGSATVRLPSLPATISVSETFVFTSVLLFGPSAGTLTVALDALVISGWSYRKGHPFYKVIFNVSALPLTIWVASHLFFLFAGIQPLFGNTAPVDIKGLVVPLLAFTVLYFSLNSWIITFAIALERQAPAFPIWRDNFIWLSLNYLGGASVAWLLVSYTKNLDYTYLAVIIPLLIVLYLTFSMSMGRVEDANRHLSQLNTLYMSTIETLAMAIDAKDQITHGHIRRVQAYAVGLARKMGVDDPQLIRAVEAAALLHDMGKLAVPEYILNKPGPLTPAEFEKMKLHASVGADILSAIDFPYPVVPIVRHHHESWNGSGYPDGLSGTDIPVGARILSVVDCFDALTSDRPYRPRLSDKEAIRILQERRGSMYDPLVVDTFIQVHSQIAPPRPKLVAPFVAIAEASSTVKAQSSGGGRFDEIAASTEEMLTLYELARGLTSPMNLPDVGDLIAKHLRRLVPSSMCIFFLYDVDTDEIWAAHATGEHSAFVSGLRIGIGQRLSGWVAANRQTIRNSDPTLDLGETARAITPRPRSCMSTPLTDDTSLIGVLTIYSTNADAFSEQHQRVLEVIARQISPIVRTASQRSRATRDRVTGLPSMERLRQAVGPDEGEHLADETSLLLIDVDDLSKVNSKLGRTKGDDVLIALAEIVGRALRSTDLLFRYQSDEFIALLLHTNEETARIIAGRIQAAVVNENVIKKGAGFSISIAAVTSPQSGRSIELLLESARRALRISGRGASLPPGSVH